MTTIAENVAWLRKGFTTPPIPMMRSLWLAKMNELSYPHSVDWEDATEAICQMIQHVPAVVWNPEIYMAAAQGCEAFIGMQSAFSNLHAQLWLSNERFLPLQPETCEQMNVPLGTLALGELILPFVRDGPRITLNPLDGANPIDLGRLVLMARVYETHSGIVPFFRWLNDFSVSDTILNINEAQLCATLQFLESEVELENLVESRQQRRAAARKFGVSSDYKMVTLRRKHPGAQDQQDGDTAKDHKAFDHRWMVGAHWRKLSTRMREQRPVFVRSYVKGPDDKPLKIRETIYRATR